MYRFEKKHKNMLSILKNAYRLLSLYLSGANKTFRINTTNMKRTKKPRNWGCEYKVSINAGNKPGCRKNTDSKKIEEGCEIKTFGKNERCAVSKTKSRRKPSKQAAVEPKMVQKDTQSHKDTSREEKLKAAEKVGSHEHVATIFGNLERKNKKLRRMLSWTVLERKGYIVELVGEIHQGKTKPNEIELSDILNYRKGVNLRDTIVECDSDLRINRDRDKLRSRFCVDDNFQLLKAIQDKKLPIRYHFGDFRSELPANVGFSSFFLTDLHSEIRKHFKNFRDPAFGCDRDQLASSGIGIIKSFYRYLRGRSQAFILKKESPKQFNQMHKRLHGLNAKRADELKTIFRRSEEKLKKNLHGLYKKIEKELDDARRLEKPAYTLGAKYHVNTRSFILAWRRIQANYMDWYTIYRLERLIAYRKKKNEKMTTTFIIVGNRHAFNIRRMLRRLNWNVFYEIDLDEDPEDMLYY